MATITIAPATPSSTRFESKRHALLHRLAGVDSGQNRADGRGRTKSTGLRLPGRIAGTVYGTIVVMATVTAGPQGEQTDAATARRGGRRHRARPLGGTRVLRMGSPRASSAAAGSRPAELGSVAQRELSILAAAAAPVAALVLAAFGVLERPDGRLARARDRSGRRWASKVSAMRRWSSWAGPATLGSDRAQRLPRARDRRPQSATGPLIVSHEFAFSAANSSSVSTPLLDADRPSTLERPRADPRRPTVLVRGRRFSAHPRRRSRAAGGAGDLAGGLRVAAARPR